MTIPTISMIAMIASALSVIVAVSMFFLVLWQAPREHDNQLMAWYMVTVMFWGASAFLMRFAALSSSNISVYFYSIALGIGFAGFSLYALVSHYAGLWNRWWIVGGLIAGIIYYAFTIPILYQGGLYYNVHISELGRLSYQFRPMGWVSFVIAYFYYLFALGILWRHRKERAGNLLIGGIVLTIGVLTSLSPALAQYSMAIISAAIASVLFARAILNENLFSPLARQKEELSAANGQLTQLAEELRVANVQLTEVNRLKSHFLANMSHELRTPLNSIIGYTDMLSEGVYGELNEKQTDRLDRVRRNGQHLLQLINDILDLSKIEAGRMELDIEPVSLHDIINQCMGTFEPLALKKNLELVREVPDDLPMIMADRGRATQVLMNLISNAVKFTADGKVIIRVQPFMTSQLASIPVQIRDGGSGPWMLVKVEDTGIGISPEDQMIIFDEFRQADGSPSRKYEGTGLGLAITRKLVELMHGYIWLTSAPGQGSTFHILLPLLAESSKSEPAAPVGQESSLLS
jgi:signal transduction histidine kinase